MSLFYNLISDETLKRCVLPFDDYFSLLVSLHFSAHLKYCAILPLVRIVLIIYF